MRKRKRREDHTEEEVSLWTQIHSNTINSVVVPIEFRNNLPRKSYNIYGFNAIFGIEGAFVCRAFPRIHLLSLCLTIDQLSEWRNKLLNVEMHV